MRQYPSRLRRLDDALADLPLDEPMLLTELDGFLTGVILCPDPIPSGEWMQNIWGRDDGGIAPFDDPLDVRWFVDAVTARYDEIVRTLARGRPRPLFDIDERNGDVRWELWVDGFAEAMALRPDHWAADADAEHRDIAAASDVLSTLIAIARNDSAFDSVQINAMQHEAPAALTDAVMRLFAARGRGHRIAAALPTAPLHGKIGRNDPCGCGSGRKSKRCCG